MHATQAPQHERTREGDALHVLAVEDDAATAGVMAVLVSLDGHEVEVAMTGPDAKPLQKSRALIGPPTFASAGLVAARRSSTASRHRSGLRADVGRSMALLPRQVVAVPPVGKDGFGPRL